MNGPAQRVSSGTRGEAAGRSAPVAAGRRDLGIIIVAALYPAAAAWLYFDLFGASPALPALYTACKVVQFLLPVGWIILVERSRLPRTSWRPGDLRAGAVSGLLMGASVVASYALFVRGGALAAEALPRIAARLENLGAATPGRFLAMALFLALLHSFLEEYYWRWFLFARLRSRLQPGTAIVLSSLAFTAHHVIVLHAFTGSGRFAWATVLLSLAVTAAGAIWAWQYARNGSLYTVWISHALVDLAIMGIGYDLVRASL